MRLNSTLRVKEIIFHCYKKKAHWRRELFHKPLIINFSKICLNARRAAKWLELLCE